MPDSLITAERMPTRLHLSAAEMIQRERQPLPSHALQGGNFRKWVVAVCTAEVKHRAADFARCERLTGLSFDRCDEPNCEQMGEFAHETHAGATLLWLSHLQTHESEKRTPWSMVPWCDWRATKRAEWLTRRRYLWAGFLKSARRYQAARSELHTFLESVK